MKATVWKVTTSTRTTSTMTINHHRGIQHYHFLPLLLKRRGHVCHWDVWTQIAVLVGFHQVLSLEFQLFFNRLITYVTLLVLLCLLFPFVGIITIFPIFRKNQRYNEHIMNQIAIQYCVRRKRLELTYGEFQMEYYMLHGQALYVWYSGPCCQCSGVRHIYIDFYRWPWPSI